MLIAIIGENCVGKTTLANKINEKLGATIYSGKDYLRLEKNPSAAAETFKSTLKASLEGSNIIYLMVCCASKPPLCKGRWAKSLILLGGGVNPSVTIFA